jgi:hypothetical protein
MQFPKLAGALAVLVLAAACGSATGSQGTTTGRQSSGPQVSQQGTGSFPGATGKIAALSGKTMQVQNQQQGQVAVSYTGSTSFSQEVKTTAKALKVGDCVMVSSRQSSGASTATVAATTVRISQPVNGSCAAGFGGGRGARGGQGGAPSNLPSNLPTNRPSGGPAFGGGAFGQVTALGNGGFTVKSTLPGGGSSRTTNVTYSATTAWTTTAKASASALKVGRCVTATGKTDATGAVSARRVSISSPVNGQCAGGFGFAARQGG